jgi:hypothetical protein
LKNNPPVSFLTPAILIIVNMGAEADTDKPHSHHALPKEPVTDDTLANKAAPGVCSW